MKLALTKRLIAVILVALIIVSALNTYLIVSQGGALNEATNSSGYDFVVSQDGETFKARNTLTNQIHSGFVTASIAINYALNTWQLRLS